jgi:cysteinyl-tRNA synthetase
MQIKDSLTGELLPVTPQSVSIYACGITPYSSAHVGHARTYVVFDLLKKVLTHEGHAVRLVRNITDIDDKIIAAAKAQDVPWNDIATRYAQENRELMLATGLPVPEEPKASEYLEDIFKLTEDLLSKGHAYVASSGDVLYRVSAFKGRLLMNHKEGSLRSEQGETRVDSFGKEDLRDFALWKLTPNTEPGFPSPWGYGRPGWHIECSAMISSLFGGSVTIHGGGVDLKFPHHQAEIMQSEPVFNRPLADIWMHNGSVLSGGQKMSKSLNNFVLWQAALDSAEALVPGLGSDLLRISLLQAHWQKPLDWSSKLLYMTKAELIALAKGLGTVTPTDGSAFVTQLSANLNSPGAFVWLRAQHKAGNLAEIAGAFKFLGLDVHKWAEFQDPVVTALSPEAAHALVAKREAARAAKDWALADSLRIELQEHGYDVKDSALAQVGAKT